MIYINNIPSLRDPESSEIIFDHRINKLEFIDGVVAQDFGYIKGGTVISIECVFLKSNYEKIISLWANKQRVTYRDEAGNVWKKMKLIIRRIKYYNRFKDYVWLTIELWKAPDMKQAGEVNISQGD